MTAPAPIEPLTEAQARELTSKIRNRVTMVWGMVTQAYQGQAWKAMGYASWDEYTSAEFGSSQLRLPREERSEVVASLRDAGLSVRAIASATGTGYGTVRRTLAAGEPSGSPATPSPDAPASASPAAGPSDREAEGTPSPGARQPAENADTVERGIDLAVKHGVATAREGFAAEGIEIIEAAS